MGKVMIKRVILVSWENDEQRELGMPRAAKKIPEA